MQHTLLPCLFLGLSTLAALPCAAQEVIVDAPSPSTEAPPPVVIFELAPAAEPPSHAAPVAVRTVPATPYVAAGTEPSPDLRDDDAEPEEHAEASTRRPFSLGLSGLLGAREANGDHALTWSAGVDLAYRIAPWARLALRRVTYGHAETSQGDRNALSASPALDVSVPLGEVIEPFAELGLLVQTRLGGRSPSFGLAPFVAAGARFHVTDWLALGAEVALTVPATEHVLIGHELFPRASMIVQLGTSIEASF